MVGFTPPAANPMNDAVIEAIYRYPVKGPVARPLGAGVR
jgi:hypothetical protein